MSANIPQLIINSPYEEPREHWKYDPQTRTFSRPALHLKLGNHRRPHFLDFGEPCC